MDLSKRNTYIAVMLVIVISMISGVAGSWCFSRKLQKQIVVMDIDEIIKKRKAEFAKKYDHLDINRISAKSAMSADINMFAERLETILEIASRDKIILKRGVVVSDVEDITASVEKRPWGRRKEQ